MPIVVSRVGISHFDLKIVSVRQYPYTKVPIVVSHVGISLLINDYGAKQYPYTRVPMVVSRVGISHFDLKLWDSSNILTRRCP